MIANTIRKPIVEITAYSTVFPLVLGISVLVTVLLSVSVDCVPKTGITAVSFSPQTEHSRSFFPSAVLVASFVTVHLPYL